MANGPRIDDEIQRLCRALTDEERRELRASIEAEGLRESLIVWQAENVLLDGHHRLEICSELGITPRFKPAPDTVHDRASALAWVHRNQLGRRNLNPEEMAYHRGKLYEAAKKATGRPEHKLSQNGTVNNGRTDAGIASEFGVSRNTIARDAAFARAVDSIERNVGPEIAQSIRAGTSRISKEKVTEIGAMTPDSQPAAIAQAQVPRRADGSGSRLELTDGMTPEQAYEKIAAMQAAGTELETALKSVGLGRHSYDAIHKIMLLSERDDLSERDKNIVRRAREELNRESRVSGPARQIAPIVERLWGNRHGKSHDQAERARLAKFDKAVHVMIHSCVVAKDIDIPHLGPERSKEVLAELDEALASVRAFRAKIKELSR